MASTLASASARCIRCTDGGDRAEPTRKDDLEGFVLSAPSTPWVAPIQSMRPSRDHSLRVRVIGALGGAVAEALGGGAAADGNAL